MREPPPNNDPLPFQEFRELLQGQPDPGHLAQLASPDMLKLLFRLELDMRIKAGPSQDGPRAIARLLEVSQATIQSGRLPISCPVALRNVLRTLVEKLLKTGAWHRDEPMWWEPLPDLSPLEVFWSALEEQGQSLDPPSPDMFTRGFGDRSDPVTDHEPAFQERHRFHHIRWLDPVWTAPLWEELEAAQASDLLQLLRAGVGDGNRIGSFRTDRVTYLTGLENTLLQRLPQLAALVQWSRERLPSWLRSGGCSDNLSAPQTAMLALYKGPSEGYKRHFDNPGMAKDNGRCFSMVLYLTHPEKACLGGELALWREGAALDEPPTKVFAPIAGSAVLFDSRTTAHRVEPLRAGPARWALTLWFNDRGPAPLLGEARVPEPGLADVFLNHQNDRPGPKKLLLHDLDHGGPAGFWHVLRTVSKSQRLGLVATVYRAGASLYSWCRHHLSLGADHLILIFDHLQEPAETALASRLSRLYSDRQLTIWDGEGLRDRAWDGLTDHPRLKELGPHARGGSSAAAVSARQALNASAALSAARRGRLGGKPLDWLLHLDADEWFYPQGLGCGGRRLDEHFAAVNQAGFTRVRYLNHEWLLTQTGPSAPRFKINPRLGTARLGKAGWFQLMTHLGRRQDGPKPYFCGYLNGKSAVKVQAADAAAGVHDWYPDVTVAQRQGFFSGPCILHFHNPDAEAFCSKFLSRSHGGESKKALFELGSMELAATALIRELEKNGATQEVIAARLKKLYVQRAFFAEAETTLLREAGLLLTPHLTALPG